MSELRVAGLVLALGLLAFLHLHPGGRRALKLGDRLLWSLAALIIIVIAVFPDAVNPLGETFGFEEERGNRLLGLLGFATLAIFLILLRFAAQLRDTQAQIASLVENLAVRGFEDSYPDASHAGIWVVIPAYNESEALPAVLEAIPEVCAGLPTRVLLISDGSSDGTDRIAASAGAFVLHKPLNLGGGAAVRSGFELARRLGAEVIVTLDADGQHAPAEMEALVRPILADEADFVVGSRLRGGAERDSALRSLGVRVFGPLVSVLVRQRLTDVSNGYRAVRASMLEGLDFRQGRYYAAEHLVVAAKRGLRLSEVPVHISRRQAGQTKKGRSLWYAFNFARSIIRSWLYS